MYCSRPIKSVLGVYNDHLDSYYIGQSISSLSVVCSCSVHEVASMHTTHRGYSGPSGFAVPRRHDTRLSPGV